MVDSAENLNLGNRFRPPLFLTNEPSPRRLNGMVSTISNVLLKFDKDKKKKEEISMGILRFGLDGCVSLDPRNPYPF